MTTEKSFPRGGVVNQQTNAESSTANIIFGATQKKIKKAAKPKASLDTETENGEQLQAFSAETLTIDTLQENMLVMGVVKRADATTLHVSLPGRLTARVQVTDISAAYNRVVQSTMSGDSSEYQNLTELFPAGRIVCGRASKVDKEDGKGTQLMLTLKPSEVNHSMHHKQIKKGLIFTGAVAEIQEHGCVLETGIEGLQAFVANENAEQQYRLGELIFVKVKQINHSEQQSTSQCEQLSQDKLKIKSQNETNLDYILPGSIVKFKVTKQLKNGLQGAIMGESFIAYVNEHHLGEALHTPTDYELNEEYLARVLYIMPLTKLVYLTFNLDIQVPEEQEAEQDTATTLKKGSIVEKARVLRHGTGGIVLLLNQNLKGLISYSSIKSNFKGNYDQDVVLSKYTRKSKHKVRVLGYDVIEALYYCSDDANVLNEKLYTLEDLHPGDIVNARLLKAEPKVGGYSVKLGKVNGIIEQLHLAPNVHYELGQSVRCRVLDVSLDRKTCYLSNRSEYLAKNVKLLTMLPAAQVGQVYTGTVVKCEPTFVLVKFCNGIKGVLHKQRLSNLLENSFFEGQTTKFRIAERHEEQLQLTLPEDKFQLGEICPIEVTNSLDAGLEIKISFANDEEDDEATEMEEFMGLVPQRLLSDYVELTGAQQRIHPVGTHASAACIMQNIFSLRDVNYFSENITKDWQSVQVGDVLRAHVKHATDQVLELLLPVRNYNKLVKLHVKMLCLTANRELPVQLEPDQLLYVKVISKEVETKTLTVSAKLTDVWSGELNDTATLVEGYLNEVAQIREALKQQDKAIANHSIGDRITVVFKGLQPGTKDWIYNLPYNSKIQAMMVASMAGNAVVPQVGSKWEVVVLWIDYAHDLLLVTNKVRDIAHISSNTQLPQNLVGKAGMKAKVLLKLDSIVLCSLKRGTDNPLVVCPVRLHPNDVEQTASTALRQGDFCTLAFIHDTLPIAVPEIVWKLWKGVKRAATTVEEARIPKKKAKLETPPAKHEQKAANKTNGELFFEDKKPARLPTPPTKRSASLVAADKALASATLPGIAGFWAHELLYDKSTTAESSSDEEEDSEATNAKKKRLSAKDKAKAELKEEQRLREIEEHNANLQETANTVEEFERLVLAEPNNSKLWIRYMVHLLADAEIDKARMLARRAIKTIGFRETRELLNVWTALLNLELRYNPTQFDDVLKEALSSNEPVNVYLNVVEIYKSNKEVERLLNTVEIMTRKFKTKLDVWKSVAEAYFSMSMSDRVQPTLQRALKVLPHSEHINLSTAFAKLYAKYDMHDMAQAMLDNIVTSFPRRTDVWLLYANMLLKLKLIEPTRHLYERAVLQKLKPDKMLVLYKNFLEFEEKYGTEATSARVKQLAEQYVASQNKALK